MVLSMDRWVGKTAVVTGASSGIGAAIVDQLVEQGLKVVGLARRSERIEEKAKKLSGKKGKLYAVKVDMAKEEDILKAFEWTSKNVGPVSILINNAGTGIPGNLTEGGKTEDWKTVFDLNVIGLCIATREAVNIMRANNIDGHIIHIGSLLGHIVPVNPKGAGISVYPASKFAVRALTETLRQELTRLGTKIKISEVSPALTVSELTTLNPKTSEEFKKARFGDNVAILQAEDIADGVVYVLSTPAHVQVHELLIKPVGSAA